MTLRALLFVQVKGRTAGAPFLNEVLGRHGFVVMQCGQ